jgi:hypothetical protein
MKYCMLTLISLVVANEMVPTPENKSEQLMGSFLASNGDFFLASIG